MWQWLLLILGLEVAKPISEWLKTYTREHYAGNLDLDRLQMAAQAVQDMNQRWAQGFTVGREKSRARGAEMESGINRELARLSASLASPDVYQAFYKASGPSGSILMEGAPVPQQLTEPMQSGAHAELARQAEILGETPDAIYQAMSGIQPTPADQLVGIVPPEDQLIAEWLQQKGIPAASPPPK